MFKLTVASAWNKLSGNEETLDYFTLSEGIEGEIPSDIVDENGDSTMHVTTLYELKFKESKAKAKREKKGEEGAEEEEEDDATFELGETNEEGTSEAPEAEASEYEEEV
jgi:hypothetical protein